MVLHLQSLEKPLYSGDATNGRIPAPQVITERLGRSSGRGLFAWT